MAETAQVRSVEVIAAFRASLLVYLSKAKPALEQISAEMTRMRGWVQINQRQHWENELKKRKRKLEEAQAELFNARLSQFQQSTILHTMAVQKAQRAVAEAETKLALLKKWSRELEVRADPLIKQIEQFHGYLGTEMARGAIELDQIIKLLDAYTEMSSPRPPDGAAHPEAATPPVDPNPPPDAPVAAPL
jgi:hypothetical protein